MAKSKKAKKPAPKPKTKSVTKRAAKPKPRRAAKPKPSLPAVHGYSWGRKKRIEEISKRRGASWVNPRAVPGSAILGDTAGGRFRYDGRNETQMDSKDTDPPKHRLGAPMDSSGGGGGAVSFDALLDPSNPEATRIEMAFVAVTQNEYVRGDNRNFSSMLKLYMRDERIPEVNGNADPKYVPMVVLYCGNTKGHPALEVHPTVAAALRQIVGSVGGGALPGRISRFYTDGGKFCVNYQDDQDTGNDPVHADGSPDYATKTRRVRSITYRCLPTTQYPHIDPNNEATWIPVSESVFA